MAMHICRNCRYRQNTENPGDCPYCGRDELEREKSAVELLDEVERILKE